MQFEAAFTIKKIFSHVTLWNGWHQYVQGSLQQKYEKGEGAVIYQNISTLLKGQNKFTLLMARRDIYIKRAHFWYRTHKVKL